VFIDSNREAIKIIQENLAITGLADRAEVRRDDAFAYLNRRAPDDEPFDVIYVAPPQYQELWQKTLGAIDRQPEWLFPNGIVIVQIDPREYGDATLDHLELYDQRRYGNTMLCFYQRRQIPEHEE
jgi:16S rRNA G966 N2-methylase RsmD